jgi:hypothetical protein
MTNYSHKLGGRKPRNKSEYAPKTNTIPLKENSHMDAK